MTRQMASLRLAIWLSNVDTPMPIRKLGRWWGEEIGCMCNCSQGPSSQNDQVSHPESRPAPGSRRTRRMSRASVDKSPSAQWNEAVEAVVDSSTCLQDTVCNVPWWHEVHCQGPLVLLQQLGADRLWAHSRCVKAGHALHRDPFVSSCCRE